MSDVVIPAPTNSATNLVSFIVDQLVLGVGEKVVIAQARAALPFLNLPVISWFFNMFVGKLAKALDLGLKNNINIIVIRFQNDARKEAYETAITKLEASTANAVSKEEHEKALKEARDAMDRLINRNK